MKLYELAEQYRADVALLQDLDMPPEVVRDTIESMQGDVHEKIKAVIIVAFEIEAEGKTRAEHAKRMAESAKAMLVRADGLRSYAQAAIQSLGLALPLKYPEFSVNMQRNPASCEVTDSALLPAHCVTTTVTFEVGTAELLEQVFASVSAWREAGGTVNPVVSRVADKRVVLDALKQVAAANSGKTNAEDADTLPGARMNPTAFRLVVK